MSKEKLILGIETSCDETSAAVVEDGRKVLSNIVSSQVKWHRKFKGVVPEIASRKHLELINSIVEEALFEAKTSFEKLAAIAVTVGPGLVGALIIGVATAKALAYGRDTPLVGVNHLEGHIFANFLSHPRLKPPFIALVVSGGHTSLVLVKNLGNYQILGETLDDASGEAFDKIAGFLELGYPGGPLIDKVAKDGNPAAIPFPRAMSSSGDYNFSLSGLKTAVLNYVAKEKTKGKKIILADLVASFQAAVVDVLVSKTVGAAEMNEVNRIVLAGGVAANSSLRSKLRKEAKKRGFEVYSPPLALCTDNAAMIAAAGYWHYKKGERLALDASPDPNLSLESSINFRNI